MHAFLIFYIALSILQIIATTASIGRPRGEITPTSAVATAIVNLILIAWVLVIWP